MEALQDIALLLNEIFIQVASFLFAYIELHLLHVRSYSKVSSLSWTVGLDMAIANKKYPATEYLNTNNRKRGHEESY